MISKRTGTAMILIVAVSFVLNISRAFCAEPAENKAAAAAVGNVKVLVVIGDMVNVREGPKSDLPVVAQLNRDDRVIEKSRQDNWVAVELASGQTGWIHASYLADFALQAAGPVAAGAAASASPAPAAEKPAQVLPGYEGSLLNEGIEQYRQENFEEAAAILVRAREQEPTSTAAAFFLGLSYKRMNNYSGAAPHLRDAVTMEPRIKEALLELIEVLYALPDQESLTEAKKWLAVAEEEQIFPAKTYFLKGLVLQREGLAEEAIAAFEKARELDSSLNQSVEIQIAMTYMNDRKLKIAQQRLETAILQDPQSDLAAFARRYQDIVAQRIELEKPVRLTLGLYGQYHTNLISKPDDPARFAPDSVSKKPESLGATANFRVDFIPILKGPWLFSSQYALYATMYDKYASSNDAIMNSLSITPGYNFGKYTASLAASYNHTIVRAPSHKASTGQLDVGPLARTIVAENQLLELYAGYYWKENFQPLSVPDQNLDTNATGIKSYLSWYWMYKLEGFLNLKYEYSAEDTVGSYGDNSAHGFTINATVPLQESLSLQMSGQATFKGYNNTSPELDFIASTTTMKKRFDYLYAGSVGLTYKLNKKTNLVLQYSKSVSMSSIGSNSYEKNIFTLGAEYRF